jgi:ABC-2 type transport system ATP-binding protein
MENLRLQGRLYGLSPAAAQRRADELAGVLDLGEFAGRIVRSYSGGQRRRLEVALGLMNRPQVLFLDEPTTGLDPQNRANLWDQLRQLRADGTTVFLTTHYLDEADQLSDRLAIVDHGEVIAQGSPRELKEKYSGGAVSLVPRLPAAQLPLLAAELATLPVVGAATVEGETLRLTVTGAADAMAVIFNQLRTDGIEVRSAALAEPSLDDVFLRETGRSLRDTGAPRPAGQDREEVAA